MLLKKEINETDLVYSLQAQHTISADGESYQHLSQNITKSISLLCAYRSRATSQSLLDLMTMIRNADDLR